MALYVCKINSTAGRIGQRIDRDPREEATQQLLARGIIAEIKVVEPEETKAPRKRKAKE